MSDTPKRAAGRHRDAAAQQYVFVSALRGAGMHFVERAGVLAFGGIGLAPVPAGALRQVAAALHWRFRTEAEAAEMLAARIGEATADLVAANDVAAADLKVAGRFLADAQAATAEAEQVASYRAALAQMTARATAARSSRHPGRIAALASLDTVSHPLLAVPVVRDALAEARNARSQLDAAIVKMAELDAELAELSRQAAAAAAGEREAMRAKLAAMNAGNPNLDELRELAAELGQRIAKLAEPQGAAP